MMECFGFEPKFQAPRARVMPSYTNTPNAEYGNWTHSLCLEGRYAAVTFIPLKWRMGFEPTRIRVAAGCSSHCATPTQFYINQLIYYLANICPRRDLNTYFPVRGRAVLSWLAYKGEWSLAELDCPLLRFRQVCCPLYWETYDSGGIWTHNVRIKSAVFWPVELRSQWVQEDSNSHLFVRSEKFCPLKYGPKYIVIHL